MAGWNADRELVWREAQRQLDDLDRWAKGDHYQGWCPDCGENRMRSQCRQIVSFERGETFAYVCATCGAPIHELPPF